MLRRFTFNVAGVCLAVIGLGVIASDQKNPTALAVGLVLTIGAVIAVMKGRRRF